MRYIPIEKVKEGMIVGEKIYGNNGQTLINSGARLKEEYIKKLRIAGLKGIYIEDELSKDIHIKELVESSLKNEALNTVRDISKSAITGKEFSQKDYEKISTIVNDVLSQIICKPKLLVNIIDLKTFDDYTYFHSVNVGVISMSIGAHMGMSRYSLRKLGIGAFMHDLGKLYIPKEILNKPGKLTHEEMEIMKTHPLEGFMHINDKIKMPEDVRQSILDHHERPDGLGYPEGKIESQISRLGSIISVADVYDALTSNRPYRKAWPPAEAIEYIMGSINSQFSENIVNSFLKKVAPYPVGTMVKLSNGAVGIVMKNYNDMTLRPKIKIIKEFEKDVEPYIIDLKYDANSLDITILQNY